MKEIYLKRLLVLLLTITTLPIYAQLTTDEANLQRYWSYRERFKKEFIKIGNEQGNSIPMGERNTYFPKLNWGDGCVHLGYYLATLATEYKLLSNAGEDVQPTLNELYYAINAVRRLDETAERYFQNNPTGPLNFNGFFIRDDVPDDIMDEWFPVQQPYGEWRTFSSNYDNNESFGSHSINYNNEPSQDQLIALLMGFYFIEKYVDPRTSSSHVWVKPHPNDRGFEIYWEIQDIVHRMLVWAKDKHTETIIDDRCNYCNCDPFDTDITINWWYYNPITDKFVEAHKGGTMQYNVYPIAILGEMITGANYREERFRRKDHENIVCPKPQLIESFAERQIIWQDVQKTIAAKVDNLSEQLFANWDKWFWSVQRALFDDVNSQMALAMAACTGTWPSDIIHDLAMWKKMDIFDLMDALLNGRDPVHEPQSHFRDMMAMAPCEGPHYVLPANRPTQGNGRWHQSNSWTRPVEENSGLGEDEEYNGLDYMLLYNLYHLSFGSNLPAYRRSDLTCGCETTTGFQDYVSKYTTSDTPFIYQNVTEISGTRVINKVFDEYEIIGITTPEHLNYTFTIKSGGKLDIRAHLNVAKSGVSNASIMVENNGELVIGGTGTNEVSVTRFFRNAKLYLQSGSKLIINNNSKLIIDKTALLSIDDGAEIILDGPNAILEIREPILFESGGTYTFSGGTNGNGYVRFNMAEMNRLSSNIFLSNVTLNFLGTGISDKIIEVTGNPLWVDERISHINIQNGEVEIDEGQKIILQSPLVTMNNLKIDALTQGTKHDGIELFGQQHNITFCDFYNGRYGIKSFSIYGGRKLKLDACSFVDCYYGVWAQDKGLDLNSCIFTDNRTSIKAIGMSFSSRYKNMQSFNNTPSFGEPGNILTDYRGARTSSLRITKPIYHKYKYGIRFSGNTVSSNCGIYNGGDFGEYGFKIRFMSTLDLGITSDAGNNLVYNNWYAIVMDTGNLYLNEGTNRFDSYSSTIDGVGFGRGPDNSIMANHNFWTYNTPQYPLNNLATSPPPPTHTPNYNLGEVVTTSSGGFVVNPIPIVDNAYLLAPPSMGACMQCCRLIILDGYRPTNDILLNTANFDNIPLSNAVEIVLDSMYPDSLANNLNVINLFHEVLTYPYPVLLEDDQEDLLEFTYDKMAEAVGNAYLNEQLTNVEPGINPYVQKLLDVQVIMAARYDVPGDNYEDRIRKAKYHIDQATTHRLVEDRATALTILNNMYSWETNPDVINEITVWDCIISREQLVLDSIIDIDSFSKLPLCEPENYGGSGGGTAMPFFTSTRSDEVQANNFTVYPNPFYTTTTIEFTLTTNSNVNISIIDINGKEVFSYNKQETKGKHQVVYNSENMSGGIYFCKIKAGNYTQTQKLILIK